jgi:hypothetical protein
VSGETRASLGLDTISALDIEPAFRLACLRFGDKLKMGVRAIAGIENGSPHSVACVSTQLMTSEVRGMNEWNRVDGFPKDRGITARLVEFVVLMLLVVGSVLAIRAHWNDPGLRAMSLLLAGIGLGIYMCYVCLLGILIEQAFLRKDVLYELRAAKEECVNADEN